MYADDTVLFYGDKDSTAIQDVLTNEADRVASRKQSCFEFRYFSIKIFIVPFIINFFYIYFPIFLLLNIFKYFHILFSIFSILLFFIYFFYF